MMPPLKSRSGRDPPASSIAATIEVVVVLPWVPAIATQLSEIASARPAFLRRTTGMRCAARAINSGLSRLIAVETTTTSAPLTFSLLVTDGNADALVAQPRRYRSRSVGTLLRYSRDCIPRRCRSYRYRRSRRSGWVQSPGSLMRRLAFASSCRVYPRHPQICHFMQDVDGGTRPAITSSAQNSSFRA